jgi:hypothetical protein
MNMVRELKPLGMTDNRFRILVLTVLTFIVLC